MAKEERRSEYDGLVDSLDSLGRDAEELKRKAKSYATSFNEIWSRFYQRLERLKQTFLRLVDINEAYREERAKLEKDIEGLRGLVAHLKHGQSKLRREIRDRFYAAMSYALASPGINIRGGKDDIVIIDNEFRVDGCTQRIREILGYEGKIRGTPYYSFFRFSEKKGADIFKYFLLNSAEIGGGKIMVGGRKKITVYVQAAKIPEGDDVMSGYFVVVRHPVFKWGHSIKEGVKRHKERKYKEAKKRTEEETKKFLSETERKIDEIKRQKAN